MSSLLYISIVPGAPLTTVHIHSVYYTMAAYVLGHYRAITDCTTVYSYHSDSIVHAEHSDTVYYTGKGRAS